MRIMIMGADGYLGWPTAMHLAAKGHDIIAVDNYFRRQIMAKSDARPLFDNPKLKDRAAIFKTVSGHSIDVEIGDLSDPDFTLDQIARLKPDAIVHYAEQPSAPYSMRGFHEGFETLSNNIKTTFNIINAIHMHCPDCHLVKLGTLGEYGTPNIDIEEGWIDIEHKGRRDKFLFPRQGGSLYHTTKIMDTDLLWFYVRTHDLKVTDLMQGPVYGLHTRESDFDPLLAPHFYYDGIFGTVLNRFIVQAVIGIPLTVYGAGGQTRGYLNLVDTLQCVELAINNPAKAGAMNIYNQFTEQFSVTELAHKVQAVGQTLGLDVSIKPIENPRKEAESHYYKATHTGLVNLGLQPTLMNDTVLSDMIRRVSAHKDTIIPEQILPRVKWNP